MDDVNRLEAIFTGDNYVESFMAVAKDFMQLTRQDFTELLSDVDTKKLDNIRLKIGNDFINKHSIQGCKPSKKVNNRTIAMDMYDLIVLTNKQIPSQSEIQRLFVKSETQPDQGPEGNPLETARILKELKKDIELLKLRCSQLETENQNIKTKYAELSNKVLNGRADTNTTSKTLSYATNVFKQLSTPTSKRPSTTGDSTDEVFYSTKVKKSKLQGSQAHTPRSSVSIREPKTPNTVFKKPKAQAGARKAASKVASKPKLRKQNGFRGQNVNSAEIAPKKFIHLFVGRIKIDCKNEEVEKSIGGCLTIVDLKPLASKSPRYKCFYLKAPFEEKDKAYNPGNWPNNVLVARYHFPRNNAKITTDSQSETAKESQDNERTVMVDEMEGIDDPDANATINHRTA